MRLERSERPLIWAGGALRADAGGVIGELARTLAAPVLTTYGSRGLLAPDHPCAVPGPVHHPAVGGLWDRADVVLAIGSDFDGMMTQNWALPAPPQLIAVNVDAADATKNYAAELVLEGDTRAISGALLNAVAPRPGLDGVAPTWAQSVRRWRPRWRPTSPRPQRCWTGWIGFSPLRRLSWLTCASRGTGWPAYGACPRPGGSPTQSDGGRSASPSRPRSAPPWPGSEPRCA